MNNPRAAGLAVGFLADRMLGDPRRFHPVAGFGSIASALEHRLYAESRTRGATYTAILVGGALGLGVLTRPRRPWEEAAVTAVVTWAVLGGRSLEREALAVDALVRHDLPAARRRLTHLVGRATAHLDEADVARAVIESVAENTADAVVAPLFWGGVGGVPGLLGYRAINTLDAMVGHRSDRYREFGWASARLDDLVNLPASRLTAGAVILLGPDPAAALRVWRRDAGRHPSPNAGPVEASFAGALGIRLGGANTYGATVEDRGVLGDGRSATVTDIERATRLARRVGYAAALVAVSLAVLPVLPRRRPRRRPRPAG